MISLLTSCILIDLYPEPTPPNIPVWYRRLQSSLAKAGLITHALANYPVDILVSNVWHIFSLELRRYGHFWFLGSTWSHPMSAAFSDPDT